MKSSNVRKWDNHDIHMLVSQQQGQQNNQNHMNYVWWVVCCCLNEKRKCWSLDPILRAMSTDRVYILCELCAESSRGRQKKTQHDEDDDEKQFILKYVQEQQIIHLLKLIIITPASALSHVRSYSLHGPLIRWMEYNFPPEPHTPSEQWDSTVSVAAAEMKLKWKWLMEKK